MVEERAQWGSSLEFILTVIGYAVGLGNVWRFPFLVFRHGGAPFLIPFFVMLFVVGIPTFFLETAMGQFTGLSPNYAFEKIAPLFQGVGYCAIIINCFIGFYYNVIIAYCIHYLLFSFRAELPWSNCPPDAIDCFKRKDLDGNRDDVCAIELQPFISKNLTIRSPSEVYFYDTVLRITDGIDNLGGLNPHIVLSLLLAWFFVFAALSKGVQSLGKISYFTATFPYVILTVLVIRGCLLPGAGEGITYYVGQFNATKLGDAELWKDATVQVFYALSACSGGLVSMSSFNAFNNNLLRDALLVPILDCLTGFYAGFAVFSVLGHMFLIKCVDSFDQVAAQGPELAFVVYPEGITLMGDAASFFSILFFAMMLALGFGSEFSIMEAAMSTIIDIIKGFTNNKRSVLIVRLSVVVVYFIAGLSMATDGGLYVLNLIDTVIAGYPLLIVGLLQVIIVPWIYGVNNFIRDIECMIGKKTSSFWIIWKISWCFLTPIALLAVIILNIALPSSGISLRGVRYPAYAEALGWVIVATPLSAIPICAAYQIFKYRSNPKLLFKPMDAYYDRYKSILAKESEKEIDDGDDDHQKEGFEMVEKTENRDNVSRNAVSPV